MFGGKLLNFFVVDALVFFFHTVGDEFVHPAGEIQRVPVRQVPAVREIHSENDVVLLQSGHIDGHVGGCAGMCLHVGVFRAEKFLGAFDRQLLHFVGVFAAAIVPLAWIAFGVLVGKDGAHGFEHRFGNEILRRNELETGGLALGFVAEEAGDLRVDGVQRAIHAVIGGGGDLGHEVASSCRVRLRSLCGR